ncbi:MAG: HisA/HisF-related TIM barrel protein [Chloroflexota bacterium]|jgi:phosphoribosylformimino-5-aminoimidazole carboxamide ribotide isomerase
MYILPSIDVAAGRSRLVWWPGASSGSGTPTDRPAVIAQAFAAQGAPAIHVVDLDGAAAGRPANLDAIGSIARAVAKPLQLAGGVDGSEQIEIAFAAGATRVVVPLWAVVEDSRTLADSLRVGGDWLAVGLDARPESLHSYPWRHRPEPTLDELVVELHAAGVRRFVFSHLRDEAGLELVRRTAAGLDAEVLVAGGVDTVEGLLRLRGLGAAGVILGEVIFNGAVDLRQAIEAVA